ncbi:MAG: diguanylate cyclase [Microthrixaceae bacterium]
MPADPCAMLNLEPVVVAEHRDPLPRLTRRVFTDLGIWMMGLGLVMGVVFPFFVMAFGVPSRYVLTPVFFAATIGAGLAVGASNQLLSRAVVGSRLRFMRSRMSTVEENLRATIYSDDPTACTPESCSIPVDSDDELGAAAASFNRLVEALSASHQVTEVSREFANTLSSHIELSPLADAALRRLQDAGGFAAVALCTVADGEMATVSSNGLSDPTALASSDPVQRAYRTLDTIRLDLPEDLPIDGGIVEFRARTVIAFPLHLRLVPIGVLVVASTSTVSDDDERLVQQLLPNLAVALNNALSHERLQRVAAIDTLTGLVNRRFGLERLGEEFSRAVRSREPLGVILFDVDHFKSVNDSYGHQAGDKVLRTVADAARSVLREGDTLMRYGGEEFLAVLPGAGTDDLDQLGDRIRREIEASMTSDQHQEIRVTVSLGAVAFPSTDVADIDDLVRHADAAMYVAKSAGRNRLTFAAT